MQKLYTFFGILLFTFVHPSLAQDDIDKILELQVYPDYNNGYCVQTIYNKLNNSSGHFQLFLQREIKLSQHGEEVYKLNNGVGTIKTTYIKSIIHGSSKIDVNAYKVYVQYNVFNIEHDFMVEKMDVWGNWESVANIFTSYYPTTINLEYLKRNKSEITSYYIGDRAVFSSEYVNGRLIGRIRVRPTGDITRSQFLKYFNEKKKSYVANKKKVEKETYEEYDNTTLNSLEEVKKNEADAEAARIVWEVKQQAIKKEQEKLNRFLSERKSKVYFISDIHNSDYSDYQFRIKRVVDDFVNHSNQAQFSINGPITINIDTNGVVTYETSLVKTNDFDQLNNLTSKFSGVSFKSQSLNGYLVNSQLTSFVNISREAGQVKFKLEKSGNLKFENPLPSEKLREIVKRKYLNSNTGKYTVDYELSSNDNALVKSNFKTVKYKKPFKFPYLYVAISVLAIISIAK